MTITRHYVAVQRQNLRAPIVFGLGSSEQEARDDAARHADTLAEIEIYRCTPELAAAVEGGTVECDITNGIATVR